MEELSYAFKLSHNSKVDRVTDIPEGRPKMENDLENKTIKNKRS